MNQVEFKPVVDFEQYGKLPFEEALSAKCPEKEATGFDVFLDPTKKIENRKELPIGIETGMVYIAVPASIAMWVGIIYLVKILFF